MTSAIARELRKSWCGRSRYRWSSSPRWRRSARCSSRGGCSSASTTSTHRRTASWPATSPDGCPFPARATNSTAWPRASTRCSRGSANSCRACARCRTTSPTTCARRSPACAITPRPRSRSAATPPRYRAALEKTIEESDSLIKIFNALLLIARAEAGGDVEGLQPFDVGEAARSVAELYEPIAEEEGVALKVETEGRLIVRGNRELIGQTIANLVDNALKYGAPREGGLAAVKPDVVISARRAGASVALTVADRGPGIAAEDRARVLDRFVRLEGSRSRPGSGLGLSLAAAVARMHGGTVELEDNAPGLRVRVTLPAEPAPLLAAGAGRPGACMSPSLAESLVAAPRLAAPAEARRKLAALAAEPRGQGPRPGARPREGSRPPPGPRRSFALSLDPRHGRPRAACASARPAARRVARRHHCRSRRPARRGRSAADAGVASLPNARRRSSSRSPTSAAYGT